MPTVEPRRRGPLIVLAVGCGLLVVLLYLVFVVTERGQQLDQAAFVGRKTLDPRQIADADDLLRTIDIASVAIIGAAIAMIGFVRQRPERALGAITVIIGANVTTQVLKQALPGPSLLTGADADKNFFPSGHATVAMSLAMAALLVVSSRTRGTVAFVVCLYTAIIGIATLTAGWHRPSDAAAGFAVATMWAAAVAATGRQRPIAPSDRGDRAAQMAAPLLLVLGVVLAVLAFSGVVAVYWARRSGRIEAIPLGSAYLGASIAIAASAFVLTGAFLAAIRLTASRTLRPSPQPRTESLPSINWRTPPPDS